MPLVAVALIGYAELPWVRFAGHVDSEPVHPNRIVAKHLGEESAAQNASAPPSSAQLTETTLRRLDS
jgi:hypothetical protein